MKKTLLSLTAGILLGASAVFAWVHLSEPETAPDAAAQAEIARLKKELTTAKQASDSLRSQIASIGINPTPPKENELDINRLLNDARPLMKSLALMFGEQRKTMTERMIRGIAERLAEEMGLTPEQTEEMIAHFLKLDEENFAKIKAMLDRELSVLDVFTVMKDMNPQKAMDSYVMEKMSPEQKEKWENRKLENKAQQLERTANWQLDRMRALNLDEDQKDKVFDILVKKNPSYDPKLAVEGVETGGETASAQTQDQAIAAVLREDQLPEWQKMQERQQQERQRWSNAMGGFDPMQLFQGMGDMGGFGWGGGRRGGARGR